MLAKIAQPGVFPAIKIKFANNATGATNYKTNLAS